MPGLDSYLTSSGMGNSQLCTPLPSVPACRHPMTTAGAQLLDMIEPTFLSSCPSELPVRAGILIPGIMLAGTRGGVLRRCPSIPSLQPSASLLPQEGVKLPALRIEMKTPFQTSEAESDRRCQT
jgi:hypothetical protein